jgi:retron-type reverse transcriptase
MFDKNLDRNIRELCLKIRRGHYRPQAARIVQIPKEDGSTRPLAISCFEDKIVQKAVSRILEAIHVYRAAMDFVQSTTAMKR